MLRARKLRYWGARLGALALSLQLAVSAGHMHPEDVFGPLGHPVVQGQAAPGLEADRRAGSAGDAATGADGDFCAICATMQLVAVAIPPSPPLLGAPLGPIVRLIPAGAGAPPKPGHFRHFQPRAPPLL
jgi:hypothetical protein